MVAGGAAAPFQGSGSLGADRVSVKQGFAAGLAGRGAVPGDLGALPHLGQGGFLPGLHGGEGVLLQHVRYGELPGDGPGHTRSLV